MDATSGGRDAGIAETGLPNDAISFTGMDSGLADAAQGFDVEPSAVQTIMVTAGQVTPVVTYTATLNGSPVSVGWSLDRGDIGAIAPGPSKSASFTPKGTTGGLVTVRAGLNGAIVKRQILVQMVAQQNGANATNPAEQGQIATNPATLHAGGGIGGVGGEGLGPAVPDLPTLTALGTPAGNGQAQGLTLLYPYDKTVWPRGMLAPLLMWNWSLGDADAIEIQLKTTTGSFSWRGTFARPAVLGAGPFIHHPIPQDVWEMATNTAGGPTINSAPDKLTVSLTVAKAGQGYGPISETWTIAPARPSGIIYYGSYGTQLAQNYIGAVGGNGMFGGAVLSIHAGDNGPALAAGGNGGSAQCRECHAVAANGSRMIAQHGDAYGNSSSYDLTPAGNVESALATGAQFPGVYPDGTLALSGSGQILPLPADTVLPAVTGLSAVATDLGTPAFAPSGALVAFNAMAGPGVTTPAQQLLVMTFNAATLTFSAPVVVSDDTGQPAETRPGWPAFFPDSKSVVFHHQSVAGADGNGSGILSTRKGAKAQIAWTGTASAKVSPLNQLNGKDALGNVYLPKLSTPITMSCTGDGTEVGNIDPDHGDDVDVNYQPTVSPIASGGYVWVVFTSRRMYGNVATIPPFCSDPRGVDLIQNITPKKLWVAAIDENGTLGTDPSHPAFYLPAQELLAGNSRGFWVLDPCRMDGVSCETGDECCNGYCEPNGADGGLVCSNTSPNSHCSQPQEKCTTVTDCCDPTNSCINGFCAQGVK